MSRPPSHDAEPEGGRNDARGNTRADQEMANLGRTPAHVLLAEDDDEFRVLVEQVLEGAGYRVTICPDGVELADHVGSYVLSEVTEDFDLIVSDIRMPGVSGLQVLEGMSRWNGFPPMILMTAFGDEETHAAAERLGAAAMLDKPFELDALLTIAKEVITRSQEHADGTTQ